ncbi:MAG: hypothetical protein A2W22_03315 [Candidatus Levybacteria bacterium RBG_16_35_11]|nr:MAG: hypothetical protein A2W22_03315 [Candidatus Levybacteria bacterium RBG_16_35_11]
MFNSHIFDPDRLGSEEEKKSLQYDGWAILVQIKGQNSAQVIQWARHTFSGDGTEFNEEGNRYFIDYDSCDRVEVIPEKIKHKDAHNKRAVTYNLIIESNFLGFKPLVNINIKIFAVKYFLKLGEKEGSW